MPNFLELLAIDGVNVLIDTLLVITTIVMVWYTARTAQQTKKTVENNDRLLKQQQESIELEYRPMMTASYIPPRKAGETLDIEITNNGKTVAKDVRFYFSPSLPEPNLKKLQENQLSEHTFQVSLIEKIGIALNGKTFSTWVPNQKMVCHFWALHKDRKTQYSAEGIPRTQKIRIEYSDERGKEYKEEFSLDPTIFIGMVFKPTEMDNRIELMKEMKEELSDIKKEHKNIANRFKYLKKFKNGSYTYDNDDYKIMAFKAGFTGKKGRGGIIEYNEDLNEASEEMRKQQIMYETARDLQDEEYRKNAIIEQEKEEY